MSVFWLFSTNSYQNNWTKENWIESDHIFRHKKLFEGFYEEFTLMWDWSEKGIIAQVIWLYEKKKNLAENGKQNVYNVDLLQTLIKALKVFSIKRT